MANKEIHELNTFESIAQTDYLIMDRDGGSVYLTRKLTFADLGDFIVNELQFTNDLNTTHKKITEAINEVYAQSGGYIEVTGTLTAGSTSITLSNANILTTSTIDVYTDGDVDYDSITVANGSVALTFEAQETALGVKVRVS